MSELPKVHSGFGAFFFPFVTVHESVAKLDAPSDYHERKIVLDHDLKNARVLLTDDGFVGLIMQENQKALEFLNTIFATALTWNIPSKQVRSNDLCTFIWDEGSEMMRIPTHNPTSIRSQLSFERDAPELFSGWKVFERKLVAPSVLKDVLNRADEYRTKPEFQEDLLLLAEA